MVTKSFSVGQHILFSFLKVFFVMIITRKSTKLMLLITWTCQRIQDLTRRRNLTTRRLTTVQIRSLLDHIKIFNTRHNSIKTYSNSTILLFKGVPEQKLDAVDSDPGLDSFNQVNVEVQNPDDDFEGLNYDCLCYFIV